jgi:cytochrome c oxidase subunit 4
MAEHIQTANPIDHAQADPHQVHEHTVHGGPKIYALVLGTLLVLTVITVAASRINFGSNMTNVIIALGIASIKGSLVALFFMHLRWDKPMNAIIFCSSLFFLGLFLITCYTDVIARPPVEPTNLRAPLPASTGAGTQTPTGGLAPVLGPGVPGSGMQPGGGDKPIPGASPQGSHGGAATGTNRPTPNPAPHK